jgi:hypothetical protein
MAGQWLLFAGAERLGGERMSTGAAGGGRRHRARG